MSENGTMPVGPPRDFTVIRALLALPGVLPPWRVWWGWNQTELVWVDTLL